MKNAVVLKIWGTMNNRSYIDNMQGFFMFMIQTMSDVGIMRLLYFPHWVYSETEHKSLDSLFCCLSIWVSQCQDKGIYLHYHANSSEYIVILPFEMFHFCYSLSQCQLGFFSLSRVERKGYTQILKKKFSQLIFVLKKKHIYIYLFQIWIQNLCTFFYLMFFLSTANLPFILYMQS